MTKPCGRDVAGIPCTYRRLKGKQRCVWHYAASQPAHVQLKMAELRLAEAILPSLFENRARVPEAEWPDGERWCSGCQGFVPLFYCTGSRCKAHASAAAHAGRVEREYGITKDTYDDLFRLQGGRCAICGRRPRTLRLAVDHDHKTGQVRGLLCANNENGCNRGVMANLESAVDGGPAAARRAVQYLSDPPLRRLLAGRPWERYGDPISPTGSRVGPETQEPPF